MTRVDVFVMEIDKTRTIRLSLSLEKGEGSTRSTIAQTSIWQKEFIIIRMNKWHTITIKLEEEET